MRKQALIGAMLSGLLGSVMAGMSLSNHFRIQKDGLAEPSYCSVNSKVNCDVVNASSYAKFLGVPNAWWGLQFYILLLILAGASLAAGDRAGPALTMTGWLFSLGGLGYSLFLAYVSFFVLGALCLECAGMYLAGFGLAVSFTVALRPLKELGKRLAQDLPKTVLTMALAGAVLAGGGAGFAKTFPDKTASSTKTMAQQLERFEKTPAKQIDPDPGRPAWGSKEPAAVLIEFSDFQCPHCRRGAFKVKPFLQEFQRDLSIRFAHYPLDQACNPKLPGTLHPLACFAAKASVCAAARGHFWEFHDALFRRQKKLGRKLVLELVSERGWDKDAFLKCMESPRTARRISKDIETARKLGVRGTPTFFLDGKALRGWSDTEFVREAVRREIAKKRGAK